MAHKVRVYINETFRLGQDLLANKDLVSRLSSVMRLREGSEVLVFNGVQGLWSSRLCVRDRRLYLHLEQAVGEQPIKTKDLTLYVPFIKIQRLALLVRGAVELGIDRIVPYKSEYGGGRYLWQKDRMATVIESALEQSERLSVPLIDQPLTFEEVMQRATETQPFFACLERHLQREASFLKVLEDTEPHTQASILVGPEGGFSSSEAEWFKTHEGIKAINLGGYVLRSETAAHTAVALWHAYIDAH